VCMDIPPVIYHDEKLDFSARILQQQMKQFTGMEVSLHSSVPGDSAGIHLALDRSLSVDGKTTEVYTLEVTGQGFISITGSDPAGVFYGVQSLVSLLANQPAQEAGAQFCIPVIRIEDAPRFSWRGLHVDVARNFHTAESLKKVIDIMAFYKLNTLHLHLTDDEGWRLQIEALPELTSVGAHRAHTTPGSPALHPAYGSGPVAGLEGRYGSGYYSQEEFEEILRYATERHVTVIPEINMPGHARAAIMAMEARYQRLLDEGDQEAAKKFRLIDPQETSQYMSAQLYNDNVINVASESVYQFVETVVDEIIEIYARAEAPLQIIHMGGDEVPAGAWSQSPMIEEKLEQLPHIDKPANMHTYFTGRVMDILRARGLKMAGWEEVALKTTPGGSHVPNVEFVGGDLIPFVWNNLWGAQDLAYRLANRGFPVVLSHVTALYFDLAYNKDPLEPGLYWAGFVNTYSAWHYSPLNVFSTTLKDNMGRIIEPETEYMGMERLLPGARENILGIQGQLWSETIIGPQRLEYYLLPKLLGLAQSAWGAERTWESMAITRSRNELVRKQWNVFANTLGQRELAKLSQLFGGYHYRVPLPGATIREGILRANTEFPGLTIRFTLDGSQPHAGSTLYTEPVPIAADVVKLKAFDSGGGESKTIEISQEIINEEVY
ncbi:MAG: beta-N-acetylhexosaminidase, partial [Bacteroidota bacterium]